MVSYKFPKQYVFNHMYLKFGTGHHSLHCSWLCQCTHGGPNLIWSKQNMLAGQMSLLLVWCKFSSLEVSIEEGQILLVATTLDLKTKPIIIVFIKDDVKLVRYIIVGSLNMLHILCLKTCRIVQIYTLFMIRGPNFIPRNTTQLNKIDNYQAPSGLKTRTGNCWYRHLRKPQEWPWCFMEQAPEPSWASFPLLCL